MSFCVCRRVGDRHSGFALARRVFPVAIPSHGTAPDRKRSCVSGRSARLHARSGPPVPGGAAPGVCVYLSNLVRDFERLHRAARVLVLNAPEDRPDFAAALVRQRILFERTMILVRWRLFLNLLSGAEVDVSGLVRTLDAMSVQVRSLAAVPTPA